MAILAAWGVFALRLAQPIVLLKISANVAGVIFIIASLHLLYINTGSCRCMCGRSRGGVPRSS